MTLASFLAPGDFKLASIGERRSAPLWLAVLALALFLPGFFSLPVMDRDEARFAQASKQMLETGDYVAIRFQQEARNKKPIAVYWLQAAAVGAADALGVPDARFKIWIYRIPSLLGAIGCVLLTFWAGLGFLSRRAAALAAILTASTVLLGVEARLATTDAVLAATVAAAMGALLRIYLREAQARPGRDGSFVLPFVFWTAIGIGVLVKGPITPMVAALAAAALSLADRSARWLLRLRPLLGLCWSLLIAAPWFVLIALRTHGAFLADSVGGDMLAKVLGAQESHGAPPGTYLAAFWLTAWPMAPFAALAAPFVWRERRRPPTRFLLAWLVPAWIVFELVPTKLPHYVLPLYPALALLIAFAVDQGELPVATGWRRRVLWLVPALALALFGAVVGFALWRRMALGWPGLLAAPFIVWRSLAFFRNGEESDGERKALEASLLAFLVYFGVYGGVLASPIADQLDLSTQLAAVRAQAQQSAGCRDLAAATTSYREPSLVFLIGTDLKMTTPAGAAAFLAQAPCRTVFVTQNEEKAFTSALTSAAGAPLFERVRGLDLSHGRMLAVDVWTRAR